MHKFRLLVLLLSFSLSGFSQKYPVEGIVRDAQTRQPIYAASIIVKNTSRGTSTGDQGNFKLELTGFPAVMFIQCMGYIRDTLVIEDESQYLASFKNQNRVISLKPSPIQINEVQVKARNTLFEVDPYAIVDFKIAGESIVALGYKNGNEFRKEVLLADLNGKKISSHIYKNLDSIYQDCQGHVFAFCADSVLELKFNGREVSVRNGYPSTFIKDFIAPVCGITDSLIFLKKSPVNHQYDNYFAIRNDSSAFVVYASGGMMKESQAASWVKSWGQQGQVMISMNPPEGSSKSNKEGGMNEWLKSYESQYHSYFETQFRLLVDFPPVFTKMIPMGKNRLIFNREAATIFWIDDKGGIIREVGMITKLNGLYYQDIHQDSGTGKIYLEFPQGPFTHFIEINPENGQEVRRFMVRDFQHIEKCEFLNDRLFFLYQPTTGKRIKKVFSIWI